MSISVTDAIEGMLCENLLMGGLFGEIALGTRSLILSSNQSSKQLVENINHILRDHLSNEHINKRQNAKTKLENTLKFRTIQRKVDFIDGQQERSGGIDKVGRSTANKLRCDLICKRTFCRVAHFF